MTAIQKKIATDYWVKKLENAEVVSSSLDIVFSEEKIFLSQEEVSYFDKLTSKEPMAELTVLLAIYGNLIERYFSSFEKQIGYEPSSENPLIFFKPLIADSSTFKEYLQEVKKEVQEVCTHKNYDLDSWHQRVQGKEISELYYFGLYIGSGIKSNKNTPVQIGFSRGLHNEVEIKIIYNQDFISDYCAKHFLKNFKNCLVHLTHLIDTSYDQISILSDNEYTQIISKFNTTKEDYPSHKTITKVFEDQVTKTPNSIAVEYGKTRLSYQELHKRSNQFGHYLKEKYGLQIEDIVGIKLDKTEQLLIVILGILKSGAAYLPIDRNYPEERITYLQKDSNCKLIIDDQELEVFNTSISKYPKDDITTTCSPNNLAYVMYTSGTTGNPKGVMVEHRNVIRLVKPCSFFQLGETHTLLSTGSISFDATIIEFFGTLLNGAKLVLTEQNNLLVTARLVNLIKHHKVNSIWMTSSWFNKVVDEDVAVFEDIDKLIVGGDVVSPKHVAKVYAKYPSIHIVNGYGPTENTTFSTAFPIEKKKYKTIPIGRPIANSSAYILDKKLRPVPIGVEGRLYVSGAGVARGYLNRAELTAKKFIKNPFVENTRMYDTGDMARWQPNGVIQFSGRKDFQVKIRGYRIELEEIERVAIQYSDALKQVIVLVKEINHEKTLVLFYVSSVVVNKTDFRTFLSEKLPDYMVPGFYVQQESIPLTSHGKVDRKKLLSSENIDGIRKKYVAPENDLEKKLVVIWQDVLNTKQVGVTDNFFELGGHSLMVAQIINRIHKSLNKNISFRDFFVNPTIKELSSKLVENKYVSIKKALESDKYPVTASQNRLWILSQLEGGSLAYNISKAVQINGGITISTLQEALEIVIARHEVLRTNFEINEKGELYQYIKSENEIDFGIEISDFRSKKDKQIAVDTYIQKKNRIPFDLSQAPLLRASIIQLEENKCIFFIDLHHIIGDGWSIEILISEIITSYNTLLKGETVNFQTLPIQYKDYSVWMNSSSYKDSQKISEAFWLKQFEGELPVLELPSFKPRPLIQTYNGKEITHSFSESFLDKVKKFSSDQEVTLFMTLMAGVKVLLHRYTNQNDIIIGTPVAGRSHPELEQQIGLYLNTLAIRTKIEDNLSFTEFLRNQKSALIKAYEHQDYPFDELINKLDIRRDTSRSALFDVMIILQSQSQLKSIRNPESLLGLELVDYELDRKTSQFDLSFTFVEKQELELTLSYNTDIYDAYFIRKIFDHLENCMLQAIEYPTIHVQNLDFLGSSEKKQLFQEFKGPEIAYTDQQKTLIHLFEEQVDKTPNDTAVVYEGKTMSYKELHTKSNQLAFYLKESYAIQPDDLVGFKLKRSEDTILVILGILKSGAAYVPIDINYPQERIDYIEKDSNCKVVLDDKKLNQFKKIKNRYSDSTVTNINSPEHLAYIIYTSGTTGKPKGVMVEHRNAVELINWSISEFNPSKFDIVYAVTSHCFDLSVFEMFYPLSIGKKVRVLNNALDLDKYLKKDTNILLNTVPSVIQKVVEENLDLTNISYINMAGEVIPVNIIKQLPLDKIEVRNLYGPSEDTTYSTGYKISDKHYTNIPIGKPLPNTSVYILDKGLKPVPIGVTGNMYVSGVGVARGYFNKKELTEDKFISNPFSDGDKMYTTGDMARWLPDGNIEFLGRKDDQVKVRGYRIELGEIESAILSFGKELAQVVVVCKEVHNEKTLVAYFVSNSSVSPSQLRTYLIDKLPEYMIPAFFIELPNLPLTPNGKINKKELPDISGEQVIKNTYTEPVTHEEKIAVQIWQEILGIEKIGTNDNFFELGGHSLKAVRLINQVNKELGIHLEIKDIFRYPTIKSLLSTPHLLAEFLAIPQIEHRDSYPVTPAQQRLWIISQFAEGNKAYNIPNIIELKGHLDITVLESAVLTLIHRHESLRTFFKVSEEGEIRQCILQKEKVKLNVKVHDIKEENKEESITKILDQVLTHSFDLTQAPLLQIEVIRRSELEHIVVLNLHHIIGDGWSMEVLLNEIKFIYTALKNNTPIPLQELTIQYKEYASWLQSEDMQFSFKTSENYWKDQFSGDIPVLELPSTLKRPKVKTYKGKSTRYQFSTTFAQSLKQFVKDSEATLFMGLMAGLKGLFYRYTGQTDIVLGTPVSGRSHSDLENQIGLFINTLAIRTSFDQSISFEELLELEKVTLLSAYEHQEYPFDTLVEQLEIKRDVSRSALFDVMVVLHNQQQILKDEAKFTGLEIEHYPYENRGSSHFDISFLFEENDSEISVTVEFNSDIYQKKFIERLTKHLEQFIILVTQNPKESISNQDYLTQEERFTILSDFSNNQFSLLDTKEDTLVTLLESQANITPTGIAVLSGDKEITYMQLQERSNQLAHCLIEKYRVKKGDFIGVKLVRNELMVIALMGIIKAGATYVPIDLNYPKERIDYIESDSQCKFTITDTFIQDFEPEDWPKSLPGIHISSHDLAYIIYTSGSTGKPKGVQINHKNVAALINWSKEEFKNTPFDIVYAVTSYCFDLSVFEMFYPLSTGKKVRILENGLVIPSQLSKDRKVLINTVPSVIEDLYSRGISFDNVSAINMAGEPIPVGLSNNLIDFPIELRNLYGPSEDTTYSSCYRIQKKYEEALPIGKPISNTQFYIFSEQMQLQPEGVIGELCISGDGLSNGYLNRENLTNELFIENPYKKGSIIYKTGDLASWMPDGNVRFFGRKDDQVKVRGYRIELGEIEKTLLLEKNISQAVVLVKDHKGDKLIVAYLQGDTIDSIQVKENISKSLPAYMIPASFIIIDKLPLTPNGKTDKKALLKLDTFEVALQNYQAPTSETEKELVNIWQEILGLEKVGVKDSFFELGGNSLRAMKLIFIIENKFDVPIDVQQVFENPTIEFLAITIDNFKWSFQKKDDLKKIVI
ncbi:non-ribosomal peptide synthetase [Aquimarina pacifica]|uniref:non-ribosomal peptide synthetase n=1 Tax=Aquimarina pacifica TaxID=1296415 RepID=UPI0004709217|nr:non-ribosomal peptide synthetase [Aquimarina pacifica]